ncbi:MAG: TolC family protein [Planctomycetota bacterium]|jgi:outer membrane protein TolC|nr:TolC family protein [Planctomycetota bacterium]
MKPLTVFALTLWCAWAWSCQSPGTYDRAQVESKPTRTNQSQSSDRPKSWSPADGIHDLLFHAETQSPQVREAFHRWEVARAKVPQGSALPDPWLSLGGYVRSVETANGPMDGRIGITQRIPWPGKLETAGDHLAALAEAQRMEIEDARLKVRRDFLRDWAERLYLEQAQAITSEQVRLLQQVEDVSLGLFQASRASQADVLAAQVESLRMSDRLDSLRQREAPLEAKLQISLGLPLLETARWTGLVALDQTPLPDEDHLQTLLLESAPRLLAIQARLDAAAQSRELASLEGMPDFSVGADWTWIGEGNPVNPDTGDDAISLSVAVELPLNRGRVDGAREQAFAETQSLVEMREGMRWRLLAELQSAISKHKDAWRRVNLFDQQLLPKAEMTYQTALTSYQAGESGFQEILDAARIVLNFRLSIARAKADAALAFADLNGILPIALLPAEELNQ